MATENVMGKPFPKAADAFSATNRNYLDQFTYFKNGKTIISYP